MADKPRIEPHNRRAEDIPLALIDPDPGNYNDHPPEQVTAIAASLQEFGQPKPVVVQATAAGRYILAAGHGVRLGAQEAGWETIWAAVIPAEWSRERVRAFLVADNRLAEMGQTNEPALASLLREIAAYDAQLLPVTGYTADEADELVRRVLAGEQAENVDDAGPEIDRAEELRQKWQTEPGQLWQLGDHRLICGDCTDPAVVARLMGGERARARAVIFDPEWDAMPVAVSGFDFVLAFCDGATIGEITRRYGDPTWVFVWDCVTSWYTPNRPLRRMKLCCWYGNITQYNFDGWHYGDAGEARTVWNSRGEYKFIPDPRGKHLSDVFSEPITQLHATALHSHSKPIDWVTLLIANCTTGDVFDPYVGSGTTIIACETLARRARAIEISPAYVAVTLERYQQATGKTPELIK